MTREDHTADSIAEQIDARRRQVLKALGAGATIPLVTGVGAADNDGDDRGAGNHGAKVRWPVDCPPLPCIDSAFGLPFLGSGSFDPEVRGLFEADHTVELQIAPAQIRPDGAEPLLDFFFEPAGIHVRPGAIVEFDFVTPEHTVTAYHPQQGREQRVPDTVPPFSSPVLPGGGTWLYAFGEKGVYDIFCAPHEPFGMVMRVIVGDETDPIVRGDPDPEEQRPPLLFAAAVLDAPELEPENIVEQGSVSWSELTVEPPEGT